MFYISKNNLVTGDRHFKAGQRYSFEEVKGVDLSNFTTLSKDEAVALDARDAAKKGQVPTAPRGETKTPEGAEEII